tara:strand:- start:570 stop:1223 length:654 start_codon:yes stop_codon:yes gene_type:complete
MATTATLTNAEIVTAALQKIGVAAQGETLEAESLSDGLKALNRMLKSWQNRGINLWLTDQQSVTITDATQSYTLTPRPFEILGVRFRQNDIDMPMTQIMRNEYFDLPQKSSAGTPTTFFSDRRKETTDLYVWPVLAVATTQTFEITYVKEFEDALANDVADFPGEYQDAVVYGLAARLADDYEIAADRVIQRAEMEMQIAMAQDRQGSVYFVGEEYR